MPEQNPSRAAPMVKAPAQPLPQKPRDNAMSRYAIGQLQGGVAGYNKPSVASPEVVSQGDFMQRVADWQRQRAQQQDLINTKLAQQSNAMPANRPALRPAGNPQQMDALTANYRQRMGAM